MCNAIFKIPVNFQSPLKPSFCTFPDSLSHCRIEFPDSVSLYLDPLSQNSVLVYKGTSPSTRQNRCLGVSPQLLALTSWRGSTRLWGLTVTDLVQLSVL